MIVKRIRELAWLLLLWTDRYIFRHKWQRLCNLVWDTEPIERTERVIDILLGR